MPRRPPLASAALPAALLAAALLSLVLAGCVSPPAAPPAAPSPGAGGPFGATRVTAKGPASEVTLAINPKDPLNLVGGAKDFQLGTAVPCPKYNVWSGVYWSKDGGKTWGNALMPGFPGDKNATLLSHYQCNSDPVVAFGADGTAYYSGLAYGGNQSVASSGVCPGDQAAALCAGSVWIAKSTDHGATWGGFVNIAEADSSGGIGLDKQWFATDPTNPSNLAMTWIQFTQQAAYFMISLSSDGAATWTPGTVLTELDAPNHQFAMPAYGPDGTLYVVWHNFGTFNGLGLPLQVPNGTPLGSPGAPQVMFTKALVPGLPSFAPALGIAPVNDIPSPMPNGKFRDESIPVIAVDGSSGPNKGHIYVTWADEQGGNADILLVSSADGGQTWASPVKVNQDATRSDQFMPWVTVDEKGGVDVSFYDRSYDANNTLLDMTLARSADGGKTWHQVRVTPASWAVPAGCYHQSGPPFIGDYHQVAALGGIAHPFYASGASGSCQVWTASVPYAAVDAGATRGNATAGPAAAAAGLPTARALPG